MEGRLPAASSGCATEPSGLVGRGDGHGDRLVDHLLDLVLDSVGRSRAVDPEALRRDVVARLDRQAEQLLAAEQLVVAGVQQDRACRHRAGRVVVGDRQLDPRQHLLLEVHQLASRASMRAAITKSLRVRPPAECVVSVNAARPQPSSMSGWWNCALGDQRGACDKAEGVGEVGELELAPQGRAVALPARHLAGQFGRLGVAELGRPVHALFLGEIRHPDQILDRDGGRVFRLGRGRASWRRYPGLAPQRPVPHCARSHDPRPAGGTRSWQHQCRDSQDMAGTGQRDGRHQKATGSDGFACRARSLRAHEAWTVALENTNFTLALRETHSLPIEEATYWADLERKGRIGKILHSARKEIVPTGATARGLRVPSTQARHDAPLQGCPWQVRERRDSNPRPPA